MNNKKEINRIMELKKAVTIARKNSAKASGSLDQVMSTLYKKYKCNSVKAAKEKLKNMKQRREEITNKLTKDLKKLQEKYDV